MSGTRNAADIAGSVPNMLAQTTELHAGAREGLTGAVAAGAGDQLRLFEGAGEEIRHIRAVAGDPHQGEPCHLAGDAVMTMAHSDRQHDHQQGGRGPGEIAELFEIAGQENDAIARLARGMEQLRAVQDAKAALARLSPAEVGAALRHRHLALVEPSVDLVGLPLHGTGGAPGPQATR